MKPLGQLWTDAQRMTENALRHADADIFGTERAKQRYEQLVPAERVALQTEVVERFGATSWDDFMKAVAADNGNDKI